ncbi:WecB/TagA/CpsF family glycosyltransferase [Rathayibacter oskolensis]|uniref:WecB/TagA/CpsF family glycosyltransferase n=1 Tax=Rathayibacter oskolensis TaxID=1891671 RepID=UPI00265DB54D|nr:WecB/TagA/CpsF family glycosyltransferase [Rathayibacter oskolensis]WKK71694.1 WecB/TagA/CpsF family glycosyltransferase [Rathayibacter oskolensis]
MACAGARQGIRRSALTSAHRIGSTDWLFPLIERDQPLTIVAVGGTPESSAAASAAVRRRTSRMTWHAFDGFDGDFRGSGSPLTLEDALAGADLVLVGMGMPRQERWVMEHRLSAPQAAFANVGGCLDYIAGVQALAPRWMGDAGIEWAYRLVKDPRRLAGRYLVEPLKLAWIIAKDIVGGRRSHADNTPAARQSSLQTDAD